MFVYKITLSVRRNEGDVKERLLSLNDSQSTIVSISDLSISLFLIIFYCPS